MMLIKPSRIILLSVILAALVALSFPAFAAENATITGDRVRLRDIPSIHSEFSQYLYKGQRLEIVAKTDFADTIDGRTAYWYKGKQGGWVFGGFVALDKEVDVPVISLSSGDLDLTTRFIFDGLYAFGTNLSEIKRRLGTPLSEKNETHEGAIAPGELMKEYVLSYDGLVVEILQWEGEEGCISSTTYTTDAYNIGGLKVGSPASDVERMFGTQCEKLVDTVSYGCRGEVYLGFMVKVENGKIKEITFQDTRCGD